jgi:hypothetical protein
LHPIAVDDQLQRRVDSVGLAECARAAKLQRALPCCLGKARCEKPSPQGPDA